MNKLSWAAIRNLDSLRESIATTLIHGAIDRGMEKPKDHFDDWLWEQGVRPSYFRLMPEKIYKLDIELSMEGAIESHGVDLSEFKMAARYSRYGDVDIGVERSSVGWERHPNFITSSAYVRLLGALEQFEIDTLKTMLYHRPEGHTYKVFGKTIEADFDVALEEPEGGLYSKPPLWSWLRKSAESSTERRKIFLRVYGIECYPKEISGMDCKEIKSYYTKMCDRRNAIAHGRELVEISLGEYCSTEAYVLSLIKHISEQCLSKYEIAI